MDKANYSKRTDKTFKGDNLFRASFDYTDLVIRLKKLKVSGIKKRSQIFTDGQNGLPLYRPFAAIHNFAKVNHSYKLSAKDLPSKITGEELIIKHRRQVSQKIENFELKPLRVRTSYKTKRESAFKKSQFCALAKQNFVFPSKSSRSPKNGKN